MKPKAPQDSTTRNVQAANKKIAALKAKVTDLERRVKQLEDATNERLH